MEIGVRKRVGPDRRGRKESARSFQGAVFSRTKFVACEPGAANRPICRRDQEARWRAPGGLSRIAAGIAEARIVFSRSDLLRYGNRADNRCVGAGPGGSGAQ